MEEEWNVTKLIWRGSNFCFFAALFCSCLGERLFTGDFVTIVDSSPLCLMLEGCCQYLDLFSLARLALMRAVRYEPVDIKLQITST